jgi:XRE family transcriptional regulator, fatty acid utilization regulator
VATLRTLKERAGVPRSRLAWKLELRPESTFEDAHAAADELRARWDLSTVPADTLPGAVERELEVQVLFVEAPTGLSGAAVHLPGAHTILINRNDPPGRRNFDLAHELFHLLTWEAMAPDRVESRTVPPTKGNRIEKLAENFAGGLLMPAEEVSVAWGKRGEQDLHDWLNATATELKVTSVAPKWRLVVLGHLSRSGAQAIDDRRLAGNGGLDQGPPPLPYSREFVVQVYQAVEKGHLSLRRALGLLQMSVKDFSDLCRAYGLALSYEA